MSLHVTNQQQLQITMSAQRLSDLPIEFVSSARRISGSLEKVAQRNVQKNQSQVTAKKTLSALPQEKRGMELVAAKKIAPKKIKNIAAKQQPIKSAQLLDKPKKEEIKKVVPPVVAQVEQQKIDVPVVSKAVPEVPVVQNSEPIRIGQEEYDALCLYADVKQEIERVWRPPAGIKPLNSCVVKIMLDEQGKAQAHTVEIQESSNIVSYDLTARMALLQATFPLRLAHKELIIVFNQ